MSRILVVCSANVCRSPAIASVLEGRLSPTAKQAIALGSAGVQARRGSAWCREAVRWANRHGAPEIDTAEARLLDRAFLERADLVLTADSAVRGEVIRLQIESRDRVFTVLEAAQLASAVLTTARGGTPTPGLTLGNIPQGDPQKRLRWLFDSMDRARGLVQPERERRLWVKTTRSNDIPDAHARGARGSHRPTFRAMRPAVESLIRSFDEVVDG